MYNPRKIYPSLLNKFQLYLDADIEADNAFNQTDEGEYKRTPDEIAEQHRKELIDMINRVPHPAIEAADCGTAFNNLVDVAVGQGLPFPCATVLGMTDDFDFEYSAELINEIAESLAGSLCQMRVKAELPTQYGDVLLYGDLDYWTADGRVVDLKTTKRYQFGKFERTWQHLLYPYCVTEQFGAPVNQFRYLVVQWKMPTKAEPYYRGTIYHEDYDYSHSLATRRLRFMCERFIEFYNENLHLINTDIK